MSINSQIGTPPTTPSDTEFHVGANGAEQELASQPQQPALRQVLVDNSATVAVTAPPVVLASPAAVTMAPAAIPPIPRPGAIVPRPAQTPLALPSDVSEVDPVPAGSSPPLTPFQEQARRVEALLGPLTDTFGVSEEGNAQRFAVYHENRVLYCHEQKSWYIWQKTRWEVDKTNHVLTLASNMLRSLSAAIKKLPSKQVEVGGKKVVAVAGAIPQGADPVELGKQVMKRALFFAQQQNKRGLTNMVALAEDHMAVSASDFDSEIWAFNTTSGTIDLKADRGAGSLHPHELAMLLTKISDVRHCAESSFPAWDRFVSETCAGNLETENGPVVKGPELERFLQKAVGMSMTGDVRAKAMFLCYGGTNTGKSTFIEAIQGIMGDYGAHAAFETFVQKRDAGGATPGLAKLAGRRFAVCEEVDVGRKLAAGLIKGLVSGGSNLSARDLYQSTVTFKPQVKLWLVCNHRPQIDASDSAMWSRIHVIPLDNHVPEERQDKTLRDKFSTPEAKARILAWAIEGAILWQTEGLNPPACVVASQEEYRASQDYLAEFLDEKCIVNEAETCEFRELYNAYTGWCEDTHEKHPLGSKRFSQELTVRGMGRFRTSGARCIRGVSVRPVGGSRRARWV